MASPCIPSIVLTAQLSARPTTTRVNHVEPALNPGAPQDSGVTHKTLKKSRASVGFRVYVIRHSHLLGFSRTSEPCSPIKPFCKPHKP